jgi:hypothetical protein
VTSSIVASRLPSRAQIIEHLEELDRQERNALLGLERPEPKPGIHKQSPVEQSNFKRESDAKASYRRKEWGK